MERNTAIGDTGFVVALPNKADTKHQEVVAVYLKQQQILLPQPVLTEVAYLVGREAGVTTVITFLQGLFKSRFHLVALTEEDVKRVAEILDGYKDSRIDFVDATVMAVAERFKSTKILTLDRRDFSIFRPQHCNHFEILP